MTSYKTPNLWTWTLKIIVSVVTVYVGIAYGFFAFSSQEYTRKNYFFWEQQFTILTIPVTEILFDSKTTRWYDWEEIDRSSSIGVSASGLKIRSKQTQYSNYANRIDYRNFLASLGYVKEAVILEPQNYSGAWNLVFCSTQDNICKLSNLTHTGKIKTLVDGELEVWGINEENQLIQLNLVKYTKRDQDKQILFI